MESHHHDLRALFEQLGLSGRHDQIDAFVASHRLAKGLPLEQAPFWSPAQADMLKQAIADDADWAEAADTLAGMLMN